MGPKWLIAAVLTSGCLCNAANILVIQPTPARSHVIAMEPFFEELASRGHNVTLLTCFPHKPPLPNLREIDFSNVLPPLISGFSFEMIKEVMPNPFKAPIFMAEVEFNICESVYPDQNLRNILESNDTFDVVITEIFSTDCFVPLAHRFKAPLISIVTSNPLPWVADRVGLPDNPSYIPNYYSEFSSQMSFSERLYNSVVLLYSKFIYKYYSLPRVQRLVDFYLGRSIPPIAELTKETSLVLVNSYFALSESRPFPPNVVEVGGIHLRNSGKPLPKNLKDILDRSTQGVLLVSFGSLVRVSSIPPSIINMFLEAFSKIPQTIIFKYEENLPQAPSNVVVQKWLPQREVIEHKNVKAVLTHGGLASIIECVHFGKPLVGIPFFADQTLNIKAVAKKGAGILLKLEDLTATKIEAALVSVLNGPSYTDNARRLSLQYRDRPMTPLQSAVFWTEYVIRHQGAPHLRPASVQLAWYQLLLLDVTAVLLLPLVPLLYIIYFLFFRAVEVSPNDYRNYEKKKSE
ncbi:UDP-glucosyltransferase 2-like [Macrosteles quadrilineatus]|uniref:UDP-glucosyltransferase 2-like n=1 Tax=Macrosteles quadrilineatus TaxID=74068 RepID=UPI0023E2FE5F|nr:UDP-glucosyltransferase 2-like [Macrosteles quadrilineatus]